MKKLMKTLLIAGALTVAGFTALAQAQDGMTGHMDHGRMDPAKMEQMVNQHLAAFKAKLKLAPSQEGAWTAFTAAMKPAAGMEGKRPDRAEIEKLPLPERIDKMRALRKEHMTAMEANMDKRDEAIKTFYAVLTPEQKKVADEEHRKLMSRRHGMGSDKMAPAKQ
jgi:Spy/CpxP family protein refolding chaperone